MKTATALIQSTTMLSSLATVVARSSATTAAFVARSSSRSFATATALRSAKAGQAEVVLVGCGAPNRGTILCHCEKNDPTIQITAVARARVCASALRANQEVEQLCWRRHLDMRTPQRGLTRILPSC
jgi:hypothetical protein